MKGGYMHKPKEVLRNGILGLYTNELLTMVI